MKRPDLRPRGIALLRVMFAYTKNKRGNIVIEIFVYMIFLSFLALPSWVDKKIHSNSKGQYW